MSDCGVCLDFDSGMSVEFFRESTHTARKPYRCHECGDPIPAGSKYVAVGGKCEGAFWSEKLCIACDEILRVFSCGGPVEYGNLWDTMRDVVIPELTVNNPCLHKLSNEARAKLTAEWWEWRTGRELDNESKPPSVTP